MKTLLPLLLFLALGTISQADNGKYLFLLSGQSNMQGMNPKPTFIPKVEKEFGADNVWVVKEAIGGRPIRQWVHDWKPDPCWKIDPNIPGTKAPNLEENGMLYNSMMKKVQEATNGEKPKAIAFCWMQGERDSRERHSAVYEKSLRKLFSQLEDDFKGVPIVFVIGRLSDFGKGNKEPFYPEWEEIIQAQENIAKSLPNCTIISTDDLNTGDSKPHWKTKEVRKYVDDLHMTEEGYKVMGSRFAEASIELLKKAAQ